MMYYTNRLITLLLLAALLVSAFQPVVSSAAAEEGDINDAIAAANETFMELFNRNDAAGVAATYTEDGKIMPPEGEMLQGRAVLRDWWQMLFDNGFVGVEVESIEVHAMGDTAVEVGQYTLYDSVGDMLEVGRYIVIWKQVDGQWLRDRNVFSSSEPDEISRVAIARKNGAFAQVNDIEMYYEIHGEGEPVLLVHGAVGSLENFDTVIPAFVEAGYQVIAVDSRARGRSTDSGQPLSYALMASDIVALLEELGIEKAHIVGESDGAIIGLYLAIHNPERVDKIIAFAANSDVNGLFPGFAGYLEQIPLADFDAMTGEEYRHLSPHPEQLPVLLEKLRHMLLTQPSFTLDELMGIQSPVLVFGGEDDDQIRPEHMRQLGAAIPNATVVIEPGYGHGLMYADPELYLERALAFLAGELDAPSVGKYAAINNIKMYYEIHGEGEPVLLMHSVTGSMAQFKNVIPILAEGYQVIAVDFRGHGRTTDAGQPLSYELMASDMVALLDQMGIDAVHIVGNKDGGIIGLTMAMEHPDRVTSLVAASVNWSPAGFQPWFTDFVKGTTLEDWDAMTGEMYRTVAPDPSIMPVMLEKVRNLLLMQPNFTLEQLGAISPPVLVLAGADEEVIQLSHIETMAAVLPNAELVLIDEAGHGVLDEQFAAWMVAVQEFLARTTTEATEYAHPEALVSTEWLAEHLDDPDLRILDTRDFLAEEDAAARLAGYAAGHIPGAVYVDAANDISDPNGSAPLLIMPKAGFEAQMGRLGIGNDTTVVVYDEGTNIWSARFWWALRYYGHEHVKLLNGGLAKWSAEGRTLETGTVTPEPATFTATVRPALLATVDDVLQAIEDPAVTIIDSLPPAFYNGEQGWPGLRVGHIPTARNLYVEDNLNPGDQTLLPMADLVALWQPIGLTPEQGVITYCGAGYAGAMNLFVLYQMGYEDISLYDGSWMEWGADLTLPVAVTVAD